MHIRKLWSWERERLRSHLLRLGPEDRRLRFCRPANDDFVHRYGDRIDWRLTWVVGSFADDALRGVAEIVRLPDSDPAAAEIALSVEGPWQGRGIGNLLLREALLLARNRFVHTAHMIALRENPRIQHLMRKFGARVETEATDAEGRFRLLPPTHLSLMEELVFDGRALISAVFEPPVATPPRRAKGPTTPR
jgi:GNAT superfamily N-acetyltransferase